MHNMDFDDYYDAKRFSERKRRRNLFGTLCLLGVGISILRGDIYFLLLVIVYMLIIRPLIFNKRLKKNWQSSPIYNQTEIYYMFDDMGMHGKDDEGRLTTIHWNKFVKYSESKRSFLVYITEYLYYIIPKNRIKEDYVEKLRELLQEKITPITTKFRGHETPKN